MNKSSILLNQQIEELRNQIEGTEYQSPSIQHDISELIRPNILKVDAYFAEAAKLIIEKERASIGMLQRMFKIGFNRAARIMDQLCEAGVVGPEEGTKPRKVLMTKEEFAEYMQNQTS